MKINKNRRQCAHNMALENGDILMFQYQDEVTCPKCQTGLHVKMVKSVLVAVIFVGLLGYILGALTALNITIVVVLAMAIALAILFGWLIKLLFFTLSVHDGKTL